MALWWCWALPRFGLQARLPCYCCTVQRLCPISDWGISCWLGQLDLMGLNFSVTVVLMVCCHLTVETCSRANFRTGSHRALHQCFGDLLPVQGECVHETSLKVVEVFVSHQFPYKLDATERYLKGSVCQSYVIVRKIYPAAVPTHPSNPV